MLNRNIGCIEIRYSRHIHLAKKQLNRNIGCIEIYKPSGPRNRIWPLNRNIGCIEISTADDNLFLPESVEP